MAVDGDFIPSAAVTRQALSPDMQAKGLPSVERHAGQVWQVLVIDDEPLLRELVREWLEAEGYSVRTAVDCDDALAQLQDGGPYLIVCDMLMPGACGPAAIKELRRHAPGSALIAVSGSFGTGRGVTAAEALSAGADRVLAKPLRLPEFLRAVTDLIGAPHQAPAEAAKVAASEA
jgi:CheY-like chemotaxis protein